MNEIRYIEINSENFEYAVKIQNEIFPNYSARENYLESLTKKTNNLYWLVYNCDQCIGISGLYHYDIDPKSAWLGWFGIIKEYQNQGFGKKSFKVFENIARSMNYNFIRLYTDEIDNADAVGFYLKLGMVREEYLNEFDTTRYKGQILILSKSICEKKLELWNNKFINFTDQLKKQS